MFDVPNLDGMFADELMEYANRLDDNRPSIAHDDHAHYCAVAQYARLKAGAMRDRANGNVQSALTQESWCDRIYAQLPEWAKW